MVSNGILGWGAVGDGVLIVLTQAMGWSGNLNYLWGALAVVWGILILNNK